MCLVALGVFFHLYLPIALNDYYNGLPELVVCLSYIVGVL